MAVNSAVSTEEETLVTRIIRLNSAVNPENTEVVNAHAVNRSMDTVIPTARMREAEATLLSLTAA